MPLTRGAIWTLLAIVALAGAAGLDGARNPAGAVGVMSCNVSMTNVAFGSVDVLSGAGASTNATLTISCSGLSVLPTNVYVCVAFPTPRTMTGPSSSTLQYDLLGPPPATSPWSNTTPIVVPVSGTILGFTANATVNVAATLPINQQSAAPGAYSQTVAVAADYNTATCTTGLIGGVANFSYQATATVPASCYVSAADLDFGSFGNLATAIAGQSEIDVQCSNGAGYSVALNGGLSGATNPSQRQMTNGASAIAYGLYQDPAHASPWGATPGSNVVNGTGNSQVQAIPVYGLVPAQTTPAPGKYSDTIVVSVSY